jgi:hypothetical protein
MDTTIPITFTWNGTMYVWSNSSESWPTGLHWINVTLSKTDFTSRIDSKTFDVVAGGGQLYIEWAETPAGTFRPLPITFSFKIRDGSFNYFGDAVIQDWLDGIDANITFTYNGTYYAATLNSAALVIHTYLIDVNATKAGYNSAADYKNFWVNQHQLSVEWTAAPPEVYQPDNITFSFRIKDELGNYFSDTTILDYLDGADGAILFAWNGTDYTVTMNSTTLAAELHTILVDTAKTYYSPGNSQRQFQVKTADDPGKEGGGGGGDQGGDLSTVLDDSSGYYFLIAATGLGLLIGLLAFRRNRLSILRTNIGRDLKPVSAVLRRTRKRISQFLGKPLRALRRAIKRIRA